MSDYIKTINNIPIVVDSSAADIPAAYVGTYAFGSGNMESGRIVNSSGSLTSNATGFYIDSMPLLEDLYVVSNGHTVSYAVLSSTGSIAETGYQCGDAIVTKDKGATVRFSATLPTSTYDEREMNRPHFVMEKGMRKQLVLAFENACDTLTWAVGNISTSGSNTSSNYYIRSSELPLDNLVGIATLDGTPITINAKTDSANLYTLRMNVVEAITRADILKIWPTATKVRIVYGDGATAQAVENAANVYVGVRS